MGSFWFRFREQDGSWSPWERCSYEDYLRYSCDSDCETMVGG